ncbi:hypothetical protein [Thermofilum sp.]|jgi:hypothetical protein|uniref:hypothetical protein n=1 Tax=Thermofilum sp. TaxID=1961369 RepID=UPI002587EC7F|nr:hypothetical protein [Thermofilum sp.]
MKVYAVFKEGVKTYYKHRDLWERLGIKDLDGAIDVSWQRNIMDPGVVVLKRPIQRGDKVLLIDHSAVSGETLHLIMKRFPGVNFVTAVEVADYYGAFFVDYMIVGGELKRVVDVTEKYVDLGDQRVELSFGPDDFMVIDKNEKMDRRLRVLESYEKRKPLILKQNPVYILLRSEAVFHRPKLVADAIGYERIGPLGRFFGYETFEKRWNPSLARVTYRAAQKRLSPSSGPVMFTALSPSDVYLPIGFSLFYPVFYRLGLVAYIKRVDVDVPDGQALDAETLFNATQDSGLPGLQ